MFYGTLSRGAAMVPWANWPKRHGQQMKQPCATLRQRRAGL